MRRLRPGAESGGYSAGWVASPLASASGGSLAFACLLSAACALLVTLPLFRHGPSCGHDFDFHLQSWLAASANWHGGLEGRKSLASWVTRLYPAWVPAANYGAGEPRFVFYPPLSWMLGSLIGSVLPWPWVPQVFTALALAGCGASFTLLARQWVGPLIAAGASCVYLAGPYLLFVAYERTAYGELLGAVAMPLVLRYSLSNGLDRELRKQPRSQPRNRPPMLPLSLTIAFLWLANAPAAVMGCYLLVVCALGVTVWTRELAPLARALLALTLGTGAAGVYVVPAWYEQRWVEIARVTGPVMRVEDSFLFMHTGEPFHDQVLHTASWISLLVLGTGLVCAGICWLALHSGRPTEAVDPGTTSRTASRTRLLLFLAGAMLLLLLLLLPVSEPAWRWAPELRFLQFPWRWLLVGSVLVTLSGALAADSLLRRNAPAFRRRPRAIYAGGLAATLCMGAWAAGQSAQHRFSQFCDEEDNVQAQRSLLGPSAASKQGAARQDAAIAGFEGTDEYTPAGADNGEIQQGLPAVRILRGVDNDEGDDSSSPNPLWQRSEQSSSCQGRAEIQTWSAQEKRLTVLLRTPCFAVLRLVDYPAWRIVANGKIVAERPHREDGLLTLPVAAGTTKIELHYQATPDVWAGRALSLAAFSALALQGWRRRMRDRGTARLGDGTGSRRDARLE